MSLTNGRVNRPEAGQGEEDKPVDLAALLARRGLYPTEPSASPSAKKGTIVERLERRFGLGDRPDLARKLYAQVQTWVDEGGEERYRLVSEVVAQAVSARSPGRYARATLARLIRPRRPEVEW